MTTRVGVCVALLVALLGGWLWGAAGKRELDRALLAARAQNDLLEARVSLLGARVSLYDGDLREVHWQLENARSMVGRAGARIGTPGPLPEWRGRGPDLGDFSAEIDEAQRLAASLNLDVGTATRPHVPARSARIDGTR